VKQINQTLKEKNRKDDVIHEMRSGAISIPPVLSPCLAGPVNIGMHHAHVSGQRIIPRECLLLGAKMTSHFLLPRIVNSIFMTRKIIRPREDRVARFAGAWIYALTFVRTRLRIAKRY
jgi:hypothetical protein